MTITTGGTRTIPASAEPVRAHIRQAWDLGVGRKSVALGGLARWAARRDPVGWVERRVSVPGDDEETRRRKALFTLALILLIPFGVVWAGLYFRYGEPAAALAAVSYVVVTIAGIVLLFRFRNFRLFWWTELALAFPVPIASQLVRLPQHHLLVQVAHLQLPQLAPVPGERIQENQRHRADGDDVQDEEDRHQPRRQVVLRSHIRLEHRARDDRDDECAEPPPRLACPNEHHAQEHRQERPQDHRAGTDEPA